MQNFRCFTSTMFKSVYCLFFLWLFALCVFAQGEQRFRLVELNAENLFDCQHDEGKADMEFLPDGKQRWSRSRLWRKLDNISKEIIALSDRYAPDLVALTEVENDSVMQMLTKRSPLRNVGYQYLMTDGLDVRGIDVALLFLPEMFRPVRHESLRIENATTSEKIPRDVLFVAGRLQNGDTLNVFVCHLPSKLNGKLGRQLRSQVCRLIRNKVDGLLSQNPHAKIVITGDFNDAPTSPVLKQNLQMRPAADFDDSAVSSNDIYSLPVRIDADRGVKGTYKYNGHWEVLDQCIVSAGLLHVDSSFRIAPEGARIGALDFVLKYDEKDKGLKPWRTYETYKYQNGYSDHLPIFIDFLISYKK